MATRFGLLVPHFGVEADQDLLIEGARLADRLGFDSLWVRDHLVFHPHGMEGTDRTFIEPFITLTYLAGVTDRIGLGAATIIPFRHPILMAYSVASLSWMTRRTFDLGVGAGNFQHEFDVIGQGDLKRRSS
jgi:alkanesulfonate monooxygenase SsuD/methylene tetrahydromethanopterin reductase-like flavin-dependent oxidoreductase (luciferase family)